MTANVLLISHGFQPNYEKAFSNGLARRGVAVTLIASDRTLAASLEPSVQSINMRGSQDPARPALDKALALLRYVVRLGLYLITRRPDNIHLIGSLMKQNLLFGPLECAFYRVVGRRFVLTVHNILPHDRHTLFNRLASRIIFALPHKLVVHTEAMRAQLVNELRVAKNRILVMEHGVDDLPERYSLGSQQTEGTVRLLVFGAVLRYKGIETLLEALSLIDQPRVTVTIAGMCRDPEYQRELNGAIEKVPGKHAVEWVNGYVPENEVQAVFESVDAIVLPYRHIDQSGVLLTAYRFGTPVIAFDVGAFATYVSEKTGIVVKDRTPAGLAKAIQEFFGKRSSFDRENIREIARGYLWENTVVPLLMVYI